MSKIDAAFLAPFIAGVNEVMAVQVQVQVTQEKPIVKGPDHLLDTSIAGVVSIDCEQFKGAIALCFPEAVFLKIYEKMIGEVNASITPDMQDGAGEILNMVYGHAKTILKGKGYDLQPVIPTVLVGDRIKVHFISKEATVLVPFKTDFGTFHLEIIVNK